jgi:hypothetical protein
VAAIHAKRATNGASDALTTQSGGFCPKKPNT